MDDSGQDGASRGDAGGNDLLTDDLLTDDSLTDAHQVVAAYWAAAAARDWAAFADLVAEHVQYEAPQTRERVSGRDAYVRFNAEGFAGQWHLTVEQIVGQGRHAASWIQITGDGDPYPGLCFFELDRDGRIARITDFWPTPSEVPASRAHLAQLY